MNNGDVDTPKNVLKMISWFLTPFGVLVVLLGLLFGSPRPENPWLILFLLLITTSTNFASIPLIDRYPGQATLIRNTRVSVNYSLNVWLIFLLFPSWPDVWLLFLLMVLAVAIYDTLEATAIYCTGFVLVFLFIAFLRRQMEGLFLGQVLMHALTIAFMGPFVNRLVYSLKHPQR